MKIKKIFYAATICFMLVGVTIFSSINVRSNSQCIDGESNGITDITALEIFILDESDQSPSDYFTCGEYHFKFTYGVSNEDDKINSFRCSIMINGDTFRSFDGRSASGEHTYNCGLWSPDVAGSYTVTGIVDTEDSAIEDDEGDNQVSESFEVLGNMPPFVRIKGPNEVPVETNTLWTFYFGDKDEGDMVSLCVDWGDGSTPETGGPWPVPNIYYFINWTHTYPYTADLNINIVATVTDIEGATGTYTLPIELPKNKPSTNDLFLQFLERFMDCFPLLKQILASCSLFNRI